MKDPVRLMIGVNDLLKCIKALVVRKDTEPGVAQLYLFLHKSYLFMETAGITGV